MRIADILEDKDSSIITVRATEPLREAIAKLDHERIGATVVLNEDRHVVGMLSERDLIGVLAEYGDRALIANVGALMTRRVFVCSPEDGVREAMAWMVHHRVRHLPVVEDGTVCGVVSIGDLVNHVLEEGGITPTEPTILDDAVVIDPS